MNFDQEIKDYFKVSEEISFYVKAATNDLYYGPREAREDDQFPYISFSYATGKISDWIDENVYEVWVDDAGNVLTEESEDDYDRQYSWYYGIKAIKHVLFGKNLAEYL